MAHLPRYFDLCRLHLPWAIPDHSLSRLMRPLWVLNVVYIYIHFEQNRLGTWVRSNMWKCCIKLQSRVNGGTLWVVKHTKGGRHCGPVPAHGNAIANKDVWDMVLFIRTKGRNIISFLTSFHLRYIFLLDIFNEILFICKKNLSFNFKCQINSNHRGCLQIHTNSRKDNDKFHVTYFACPDHYKRL